MVLRKDNAAVSVEALCKKACYFFQIIYVDLNNDIVYYILIF
jgi:hypothetical protein